MRYAITGASGRLGRSVTRELRARAPDSTIRLFSRNVRGLAPDAGMEPVSASFDDPASLVAAFRDVDVAVLISTDAPLAIRRQQHRNAIDAAKAAGVGRLLYTSVVGAQIDGDWTLGANQAETEADLKASGLTYTILRNNFYAETLDTMVASSIGSNRILYPANTARVSYAVRDDLAAAIAGAMVGQGHENKTYELTGNEAITTRDMADVIAAKRGTAIDVIDAPDLEYAMATLVPFGVPTHIIEGLLGVWKAMRRGDLSRVSQDGPMLAGRPMSDIRDYIRAIA